MKQQAVSLFSAVTRRSITFWPHQEMPSAPHLLHSQHLYPVRAHTAFPLPLGSGWLHTLASSESCFVLPLPSQSS